MTTVLAITGCELKRTIPRGTILGIEPSLSLSLVQVSPSSVAVGNTAKITLFLRDSTNLLMVAKRYQVKLTTSGGTSVGNLSDLVNQGDGSYVASFTAVTPGSAVSVQGWSYNQALTSTAPQLTVVSGPAAAIQVAGNNQQTGTVGALLALPLAVKVSDVYGNPVIGSSVSWSGGNGEGDSVAGCTSSLTNAEGVAICTPTLGQSAGTKTFTAAVVTSLDSLGLPVTSLAAFTATAAAQTTIASLAWGVSPAVSYSASSSTPMTSFTVRLQDQYGNLVSSNSTSTVSLSVGSGLGVLGGVTTATVAGGVATLAGVTATTAGTITLLATENTTSHTVSQAGVVVSAGVFSLGQSQISSNSSLVSGLTILVTLTARDAFGNLGPSGVNSVAFTASATGGTGTFAPVTALGGGHGCLIKK